MGHRILVANRGEIAIRGRDAVIELRDDHTNPRDLEYVMMYTAQDKHSLHAQDPTAVRVSHYDHQAEVLQVAKDNNCDAIFMGYAFLSENDEFIWWCEEEGITPLTPRSQAVALLGDKAETKRIAKRHGVKFIPGSTRGVTSVTDAQEIARELVQKYGPNILLKAVAGGGGRGIYEVRDLTLNDLNRIGMMFNVASAYANEQFNNKEILLETLLEQTLHIELQLNADHYENIVHFETRNCTIQTPRRQKRVEIGPAFNPNLKYGFDPVEVQKQVIRDGLALCSDKEVGYNSVGTYECLVMPDGRAFVLEVNTRIQVENAVSARRARIKGKPVNLIAEQIRIGLGEPLGYTQKDIQFGGYGNDVCIEYRILAEDVERHFTPETGTITKFEFPDRDYAEVHTHIPGDRPYTIVPRYDPNLALVTIIGESFEQAQARGQEFLENTRLEGTNSRGRPMIFNLDYLKTETDNVCKRADVDKNG